MPRFLLICYKISCIQRVQISFKHQSKSFIQIQMGLGGLKTEFRMTNFDFKYLLEIIIIQYLNTQI